MINGGDAAAARGRGSRNHQWGYRSVEYVSTLTISCGIVDATGRKGRWLALLDTRASGLATLRNARERAHLCE